MKNKKLIIIFLAIISIIIISVCGYFVYNYLVRVSSPKTNSSNISKKVYNLDETNTYGIAFETARDKGYNAGQVYLDDKLKLITNPKQEATVYIYKSSLAGSEFGNDQKRALEYAYKAESIYPSKESALRIAIREEKVGNTKDTLKYYKLYLERMKKYLADYNGKMKSYYDREYQQYLTHTDKLEKSVK